MGQIPTYGYMYQQHFNPYSYSERLITYSSLGCPSNQFKMTTELQSGVTYILIVTTFGSNIRGNFSVIAFGPNNVTFKQISKSHTIRILFFCFN